MFIKGAEVVAGDVQSHAINFKFSGGLVAATTTAVGGVLKLLNDTGKDLMVELMLIQVTTASTGVATLDIGVDDGGDVSSDNLIDGVDVNTAPIIASNVVGGGTNGKHALWKKGEYIVATASATVAGLVGKYTIKGFTV